MKVLVSMPVDEALAVRAVLRAVCNIAERPEEPHTLTDDTIAKIAAASARIANAITRQTTPRSLVSHED